MSIRTATKPRGVILRAHEARRLAEAGETLVVREVKLVQFGPSDTPGYDFNFRRRPGGVWEDYRTADLLMSKYCPLGPVGLPLYGREAYRIVEDPGADVAEIYRTIEETDEYHNTETLYYVVDYKANGGTRIMDRMGRPEWRSPATMPRSASRFPRLVHDSCEVKQVRDLTSGDIGRTGMHRSSEEAVLMANRTPEVWLWCSLIRNLDRSEAADA